MFAFRFLNNFKRLMKRSEVVHERSTLLSAHQLPSAAFFKVHAGPKGFVPFLSTLPNVVYEELLK